MSRNIRVTAAPRRQRVAGVTRGVMQRRCFTGHKFANEYDLSMLRNMLQAAKHRLKYQAAYVAALEEAIPIRRDLERTYKRRRSTEKIYAVLNPPPAERRKARRSSNPQKKENR